MSFNLSGILSLNNKSFVRGIKEAEGASSKLNGVMRKTGSSIASMISIGAGIAGLTIGVKDTIDTFADFEKKMSNVQAITDETSQSAMTALTEKAKEMGRILPASASDAADAMANLGSAGFNTNEIMKSVEGTLYLATSAQTDMATAADITSSTLRGFNLEAEKANHVADVMAKTASATNAGILDLGESMKYAAPVAHAFEKSLEETSAAIGIMANAGIKGSQSGTTLRTAFVRLAKPMKPAKEAMDAMGFSAFDAEGNMNSLSKIISDLRVKTKKYTKEQKNAAIATIFGQEALSGMLALIDAGPEKLDALTESLIKSDGASKKMAETQTNNLYGAMQELEGAFETAKISIGEELAPFLSDSIRAIADQIPYVTESAINLGSSISKELQPITEAYSNYLITEFYNSTQKASGGVNDLNYGVTELGKGTKKTWQQTIQPAVIGFVPLMALVTKNTNSDLKFLGSMFEGLSDIITGVFTIDFKQAASGFMKTLDAQVKYGMDKIAILYEGIKAVGDSSSLISKNMQNAKNNQNSKEEKIKANANGTSYFKGGSSLVNERGGEMQILKNGTSVIPADRTKQLLEGKSDKQVNMTFNIDARGMDVNELVTTLKLRLANI